MIQSELDVSFRKSPRALVLGGINGAGIATASRALLADTLKLMTFVNADVIAQVLSGCDVEAEPVSYAA